MKNIIDAIVINGVIYNRIEAKTEYTCDECDLGKICSNNSDLSNVCIYASEIGYAWKINKQIK